MSVFVPPWQKNNNNMQTTFTSSPCSRCRHFQLRRTAQCKINEPADVFVVQFFRTRRRVRRKAAAAVEKKQKQAELLRQWLKFIVSSSCPTRCFFFHLRLPPLVSGFFSAGLIKKKKKKSPLCVYFWSLQSGPFRCVFICRWRQFVRHQNKFPRS